jgi:lysozyme
MAYQLGIDGLLAFERTLALLDEGKYIEAADEAQRSRWDEQTPNRAQRVTDWMREAADEMEVLHDE